MGSYYVKAGKEVLQMAQGIIDDHYHDMARAEVTVEYLFAHANRDEAGNVKGPAIKVRGRACAGTCKINNLKARVAGRKDVEITLDGDEWPEWSLQRQLATLDHELAHVRVIQGQADDAGRPKLKLWLHSFEVCGFDDIIRRYGAEAHEAEAAIDLGRRLKQMEFAWG